MALRLSGIRYKPDLRNMTRNNIAELVLLGILTIVGFMYVVKANLFLNLDYQQFVDLANSFLHGRLSFFPNATSVYDASLYKGNYFWPLGPLPAILLMPFVWGFGLNFLQGNLQFILVTLCFLLLYTIAMKILKDKISALWLSLGFIFSSAFIGIVLEPQSWQFAQVVATMFILAALYEFYYARRWVLIGFFVALAVTTRSDLILTLLFFAGNILFTHMPKKHTIFSLVYLLSPIILCVVLLLLYNFLRFGNMFEQGYVLQHLEAVELLNNRAAGIWSIMHIPANLYYFLFQGPVGVFIEGTKILVYPYIVSDTWGMSIVCTSPFFLWIVTAPFRKKEVRLAGITTLLLAIAIFGYYGIGFSQYGYRYAIDFYPFLFLILLYAVKDRVSLFLKTIILVSFFFNLYMFQYLWLM
jgi:hypothetical protein